MLQNYMNVIVGIFIMASVLLGMYVNPNWFWFTLFVGANLFQSGFTKWCLLSKILLKLGVKNEGGGCKV